MSEVSVTLPVSRRRAWLLLEDPRAIRLLVAGARTVRRFDPCWPDVGTAVHHSVGLRPLVLRDATFVTVSQPERRLVLKAQARPLVSLRVEFLLDDDAGGCRLTIRETPVSGLLALPVLSRVTDLAVGARNAELCRRFKRLVQDREDQARREPQPGPAHHDRAARIRQASSDRA